MWWVGTTREQIASTSAAAQAYSLGLIEPEVSTTTVRSGAGRLAAGFRISPSALVGLGHCGGRAPMCNRRSRSNDGLRGEERAPYA